MAADGAVRSPDAMTRDWSGSSPYPLMGVVRLGVSYVGRLARRTFESYSFGRRILLTPHATARPNPPKLRHQDDHSSDVGTDTLSSREGCVLCIAR
jgi:hypothetical protein